MRERKSLLAALYDSTTEPGATFARFSASRSFPFEDGCVVLTPNERVIVLNCQAARLWAALEAGLTKHEICSALAADFPADADRIRSDVGHLIARWNAEVGTRQDEECASPFLLSTRASKAVWSTRWKFRLRNLAIELLIESTRRARSVERLIAHLPMTYAKPDVVIKIVEDADDEAVILIDGHEFARGYCARNLQRALLRLVWPDEPLCALIHASSGSVGNISICMAGPSGSGKTTLLARLLRMGVQYLADDLTPLNIRGQALPWPMPMSIKQPSWSLLEQDLPRLSSASSFEMAGTIAKEYYPDPVAWDLSPVTVGAIVFPTFVRGAATQMERISGLSAIERLGNGLGLESPVDEARVESFLSWIGRVHAYSLVFSDLNEAAQNTLMLFKGE